MSFGMSGYLLKRSPVLVTLHVKDARHKSFIESIRSRISAAITLFIAYPILLGITHPSTV